MIIHSLLKICIVGAASFSTVAAQQNDRSSYGLFGHYGVNNHSADFQNLPGAFSCGANYTSGSGSGLALGGLYELPLANALKLSLRAGYSSDKATLTSTENQLLGINGESQNGTFEKSLIAEIATIGLEPIIGYNLYKGLNLHAGGRIGFLMQKSYEQKEEIVSPGGAVFTENQSRTRNESSGDIQNTSALQAALLGGISYDIPLSAGGTFIASPEVFYSLGLTSFVSDLDWSGNALRAGVSLKFSPLPAAPVVTPPPAEPTPTPEPAKPALAANVAVVGLDETGRELPVSRVVVEDFLQTYSQPLLPYIFFDDNSAEIPVRYNRLTTDQAKNFSLNNLYSMETLPAYHEILDIVGMRMANSPDVKITLTGANSNAGAEKNNTDLSKRRAESVKNYLVNVWKIDGRRVAVQSRNLPQTPSNTQETDGIEENRRVEISSTSQILAPLLLSDTLRTTSPSQLRFKTNISEATVPWRLTLLKDNRPVGDITGTEPTRDISTNDIATSLGGTSTLSYRLSARSADGRSAESTTGNLPVEIRDLESKRRTSLADKEIETYSLMLFEFDKADLTPENERAAQEIKKRIRPTSTVTVTGYTDRFGAPDYNQRLSEQRAANVARVLGISSDRARGLGESVLLYDNSVPEGRFYSRTINVTIETPIGK